MIVFDELRVTNFGDRLIVRARVRTESYYTDVYIDKIIVDTEETYTEGGPSNNPVFTKQLDVDNKEILVQLDKLDLSTTLTDHLFFVYIVAKGTPSSDTPCGMDEVNTLGVTMYMGNYYNTFMSHIKELGSNCQVPQSLINDILKYKALTTSIDAGHYIQGINYFNKWFSGKANPQLASVDCGCHG